MHNRTNARFKVIHRHKVGRSVVRRVSELVFDQGHPKAILGWIDVGGQRTPISQCDLDPAKLRKAAAVEDTYYYDAVTVDPRYEDLVPPAQHARRAR